MMVSSNYQGSFSCPQALGLLWAHNWRKISAVLSWGWKLRQMPIKSGFFGQDHALPRQSWVATFFLEGWPCYLHRGSISPRPSSLSDVTQSAPLVLITTPGPGAGSFQKAHVVLWWGKKGHSMDSTLGHAALRSKWVSMSIGHKLIFSSAWKCPLRSCFSVSLWTFLYSCPVCLSGLTQIPVYFNLHEKDLSFETSPLGGSIYSIFLYISQQYSNLGCQ